MVRDVNVKCGFVNVKCGYPIHFRFLLSCDENCEGEHILYIGFGCINSDCKCQLICRKR